MARIAVAAASGQLGSEIVKATAEVVGKDSVIGPGWIIISVILIAFHFMLPLLVLLTRRTKRAPQHLVKIACYMLVMRFVDIYWLVTPSFSHGGTVELHLFPNILYDLAGLLAVGGIWVMFFAMMLKDKPLVPLKDKRLQEALEGAGGHH